MTLFGRIINLLAQAPGTVQQFFIMRNGVHLLRLLLDQLGTGTVKSGNFVNGGQRRHLHHF